MVAASVTRFNFLKHVKHFDVQSSKPKKEKKKKILNLQFFGKRARLQNILKSWHAQLNSIWTQVKRK